jgi:phage shock protein C
MSSADELAKLHDLLAKGALSQAEYEEAKARVLGAGQYDAGAESAINRFRLSDSDRWIGGVCGGIAAATSIEAWVWRLLFVLLLLPTGFFSGLLYLLLWIFVPRETH